MPGGLSPWLVSVELVAGLPQRPGSQQSHFLSKDVFVCSVRIYVQRIRGFTTMRCINLRFAYLLTYFSYLLDIKYALKYHKTRQRK